MKVALLRRDEWASRICSLRSPRLWWIRTPREGEYWRPVSKADVMTCLSDLEGLQIRDRFGASMDRLVRLDNVVLTSGPRAE